MSQRSVDRKDNQAKFMRWVDLDKLRDTDYYTPKWNNKTQYVARDI